MPPRAVLDGRPYLFPGSCTLVGGGFLLRLLWIAIFALVSCQGANATAAVLPGRVRVDVLSLLSPRRVIATSASSIPLSIGKSLPAGARLVVSIERRQLAARLNGREVWRGDSFTIGAPGVAGGSTLTLEVTGRNSRLRRLPAPVSLSVRNGRIAIVADFALEELVASSVAAEMHGAAEPAALEAAAVAIRSYLAASAGRHSRDAADVCDSTHCLHSVGLIGSDQSNAAAVEAARRTSGRVLVRDGRIVAGYISACCGGRTTTPAALWGGADNGDYVEVTCNSCRASPYFAWTRRLRATSVAGALTDALGKGFRDDISLGAERGSAGWVKSIRITAGGQDIRVDGDEFRLTIGRRLGWDSLPSPNFSVSRERGVFIFRGAGFGHGLGLCLAGAVERARLGDSADAILRTYFPRATVESLPRTASGV